MTDKFFGSLYITTFRKLPKISPNNIEMQLNNILEWSII